MFNNHLHYSAIVNRKLQISNALFLLLNFIQIVWCFLVYKVIQPIAKQ